MQLDALKQAVSDAKHIFSEKVSGAKNDRPALTPGFSKLKKGDTLLVWRLDRLGRSIPQWAWWKIYASVV